MSDKPPVDILLATYNGAKYLKELLRSIEEQTYENWTLIIRDDHSSDQTLSILNNFALKHPKKVLLLPVEERGGVISNFSKLMAASTAPYVCLCDQDDVWDKTKIETQFTKILEMEKKSTVRKPLLVHSDLRVVSQELKIISNSFWSYSKLYPKASFPELVVQNVVTGCALMCNQTLLQLAYPLPSQAIMHDWWLALVASAFGEISEINEPTLSYRQHCSNTLGAMKFGTISHLKKAYNNRNQIREKKLDQTAAFLNRYSKQLSEDKKTVLLKYLSLREMPFWKSRMTAWLYGFRKQGILRQILAFLFLKFP